ncbi:site-specific integrase [Anatilimnocola floriformis]|uniref:site-specific integrase n=1 Tax=Anatilimnocola floriformis TaxID=2948575 RepID=UPI0020C1CF27|nr:site-specific integrase [Anatilimnocola floriformis]
MTHTAIASPLPATIRLFDPTTIDLAPDDPSVPSVLWRLSQVFERCFTPLWIQPQALTDSTSTLYLDALGYWKKLVNDPPIGEITDYTTALFTSELLKQPGRKSEFMSIGTVRKHCTQIDKLLAFTGPKTRDKQGRKNLGLLDLPPMVDKPQADDDPPNGDFSLDEVQRLFAAADKMTTPRIEGVTPAAWWRALIVVACFTGLRISQLMRLEYADLNAPFITVWARNGSKGRKGKKQFLHPEALADILAIRTERTRIFEFPNWDKNKRWLQTQMERLLQHAAIPEERQFKFHGFRKMHATLIADQEGSTSSIQAAQLSLGHSHESTTKGSYINGSVQQKIVTASIQRLPSPKAKKVDDKQMQLFT